MCEPECKVCWFQATNKELDQLKTKSVETNSQLQEAVRSVLTVQNAVEDIIRKCNQLEKLGEVKPDYLREKPTLKEIIKDEPGGDANVMKNEKHFVDENPKDDVLFVSISSGLTSEGTFWCRYWTTDVPYNDSRLHQISDELGWMEKDLSVEKAESKVSDQLVFCYSQVHGLYLRAVILKYAPPDTEVRFLDLGRVEFVSANITFYILPEDHVKRHPFLNIFCSLYMEKSKPIPREAKWCFRDITDEKVLIARVINTTKQDGLTCHHVEMKTMVGEHKTINKEIMNKILEYEEFEKRKAEEKQKSSRKKSVPEESKVDVKTKDTVVVSKNATYSTERLSLVKEYLLNQKRIKPRLLSENMSSDTKVDKTRLRSKSLSNVFDIDPSLINLYDGVQVANGKEKPNAKWWEKIPDERRDMVPKRLPPVKNMFYSKYILRVEKWNEVELMNVDDLLKSESKMIFYAFQLSYDVVELSFNSNFTYFKNQSYSADTNNIEMNMGNVSQYFFLLNEDTNGMPPDTYQIFGLARVETMKRASHGILLYVSYYSVSNIGECKIEFSSKESSVLDLTAAKILVTKIKVCLERGEARPQFVNYYPWCGIPPLVELVKPAYPAFHHRNQNKNNKRQDDYKPRKQNKGRSFRDKPRRKSSLDNWRSTTSSERSSVVAVAVATACNVEDLNLKTLNSDQSRIRGVENSESSQDKYIVPSESESCWMSPRNSKPTYGDCSTSTPKDGNSCDNIDDSNQAKIVNGKHNVQNEQKGVSLHGHQSLDIEFQNGEVSHNHIENVTSEAPVDQATEKNFKPFKILQRPKKDDGSEVCNPDSTAQEYVPLQQSIEHEDQDKNGSHSLENKQRPPDILLKEERPPECKIGYYDDSGLWLPRYGPSNNNVPKED